MNKDELYETLQLIQGLDISADDAFKEIEPALYERDRLRAELALKEKKLKWAHRREDRLYRAARAIAKQRDEARERVQGLEKAYAAWQSLADHLSEENKALANSEKESDHD